MQLFYVPEITENEILLDEVESKHAIRVLRLKTGEKVQVVDGKGGFYTAEIIDTNPKKSRLRIIEAKKNHGKSDFYLHIAIAPTKNNDRFEWFLEKATEIGIDEITPLICEHSERKTIKPDRLEKIVVSAMKQSLKTWLPKLNPMVSLHEFIKRNDTPIKFIAHCNEGTKPHLKNEVEKGKNILVLIGPEGDFSPEEVNLARMNGFREISLGNSRLRTETAGIVACHIVNLINEKE